MSEFFEGFKNPTFRFLKELKQNNNRDWFNANKERYLNDVLEPSLLFVESIAPKLKKISPHFTAIAKRTGGSLMRIYRDTRFSKNKQPYKTNIGIQLRHEFGKDVHAPGFYIHIEPGQTFFGAGIWHPDNATLRKIRDHIVENEAAWARIANNKKLFQNFEFAGESLKRPPRDFDKEHKFIVDLMRKDFIIVQEIPQKTAKTRDFVDLVIGSIRQSKTLMKFLCDAIRVPC